MSNSTPHGDRYFRLLLVLLPTSFRKRHGYQLEELFLQLKEDLGEHPSAWALGRLYLAATWDVLRRLWPVSQRTMRRSTARDLHHRRRHSVLNVMNDLKHATRSLVKRPTFTAVVVLTVAVGVGGNVALFSVVNAVLLRPLAFNEPDKLVTLDVRAHTGFYISLSVPNYMDWEERNRSFESIGGSTGWTMTLAGLGAAEVINGRLVIGDFFGTLGVEPLLGRAMTKSGTLPGAEPVAVLGHRFWQRKFGNDPNAVGQTVTLDGQPYSIVGVMPPEFGYPASTTDIYVPMGVLVSQLPWNTRSSAFGTRAIARLAPGVTLESAQEDMDRVGRQLREEFGNTVATAEVRPFAHYYIGDVRMQIWLLMGAVAFVLLIVTANVGNLLLVRGEDRRGEFAVRTALGASRGVVLRQLLTEGAVLSFVGGALGLVLAYVLVGLLVPLLPDTVPVALAQRIGIDGNVLLFTLTLTAVTGLIFGLLPAIRVSSESPLNELRTVNRVTDSRGLRLRSALIVTEVALATVLLIGAGLMVKSLARLRNVDKGFSSENVLTARVSKQYADSADWRRFYSDLLSRAQSLPGVQSAALTLLVPLTSRSWEFRILPEEVPWDDEQAQSVLFGLVSQDYFQTLDVPLLRGRTFTESDRGGTEPVVIVDETMAERFWPGEDPLGKRVSFDRAPESTPENPVRLYRTVVGITKNVRHYELVNPSRMQIYVPFRQTRRWGSDLHVVLKTSVLPTSLVAPLRREVSRLDSDAPLFRVQTLDAYVDAELAGSHAVGNVLLLFGAVALLLAGMGIYGVVSYSVARRTREIGVRMALGARQGEVVRWIARQGLSVSVAGVVIGLGAAVALTRVMSSLLFEVSPIEPITYAGLAVFLLLVAAIATYLPARRATRVDPVTALRQE